MQPCVSHLKCVGRGPDGTPDTGSHCSPSLRRVMNATMGTTTSTQIFVCGDAVGCFASEPWPNNTSRKRNCSTPTMTRRIWRWREALQTLIAGAATDTAGAGWMNSTTSACAQHTAAAGDCYASAGAGVMYSTSVGARVVRDTARATWMNSTISACAQHTAAAGDCYASGGAGDAIIKLCESDQAFIDIEHSRTRAVHHKLCWMHTRSSPHFSDLCERDLAIKDAGSKNDPHHTFKLCDSDHTF